MDLLTGLLLVGVVVAIVVIVVRELFDETFSELAASYFRAAPNPVESGLIGRRGEVLEEPDSESGRTRVRVGREIWTARFAVPDFGEIAPGTAVTVTAVDGMVLHVEKAPVADEAST